MLSESGQYWGHMGFQSLNVIRTLVNGILQSDSGLLLKSSGNKSLTAVNTGDDQSPTSMRVDIVLTIC